jgi:hypothetical protein
MDSLDIVSLVVLALFLVLGLGVFTVLGYLPGYLAKRRHSPWAEAINICGWFGTLVPPIWVAALVWAYIQPRTGPGAALAIDESEARELASTISAISSRLASLEQKLL